jgi:hypothetical protein
VEKTEEFGKRLTELTEQLLFLNTALIVSHGFEYRQLLSRKQRILREIDLINLWLTEGKEEERAE